MVKALVVLAFLLPVVAYVAGSLVSTSAGEPADRGPVIIQDPAAPSSPSPSPTRRQHDDGPVQDNEARVVTPAPTALDDDDDDDDGPEGDDDDDDDRSDTDDD